MRLKFRCLVLDHDDTVVNSTATIHYPAFLEYMKIHRPGVQISLEEYFALNFEPGVIGLFRDICGLSEEEMRQEEAFWRRYVKDHVPSAYSGIRQILEEHKQLGGLICVVSHSFSDYILRDYRCNGLPVPDRIYGWDLAPGKRKPDPFALFEIMKDFSLRKEDLLVVDDLKPGYDMAMSAGVPFAAAGWANDVPQIESFMRSNCEVYCKNVSDLRAFLS